MVMCEGGIRTAMQGDSEGDGSEEVGGGEVGVLYRV